MNRWLLLGVAVALGLLAGCRDSDKTIIIIPPDAGGNLVISPATLPAGVPGALYSQYLWSDGAAEPCTWSITSGSPPDGIDFVAGTGELAGTPTQVGTFTFGVTVTDSSAPPLQGYHAYKLIITDGSIGWRRAPANPVLTEDTGWEAGVVGLPCVVREDGGTYKMFYSASDTLAGDYQDLLTSNVAIGLATSTDGINWTKNAGNPVLTKTGIPSDPDGAFVGAACVVKRGATYHMWYTGANTDAFMSYQYPVANICHATSLDGVAWSRRGMALDGDVNLGLASLVPLIIDVDATFYFAPWVIYDDDENLYKMWFTYISFAGQISDPSNLDALTGLVTTSIGYATSPDSITWSIRSTAALTASAPWEESGVSACCVLKDAAENCYKMYYTGSGADSSAVGFAKSTDGVSWTKSAENPVFTNSSSRWDSQSVGTPCVLKDSAAPSYKMWYTGSQSSSSILGRIGRAVCP